MTTHEYFFEPKAIKIFDLIKDEQYRGKDFVIPVFEKNLQVAVLKPITRFNLYENIPNHELIKSLADWRRDNQSWYPTVFTVTEEGTKLWLKNQVIDVDDRILFLIVSLDGVVFGHMGLFRGEIDNVLRGITGIVDGGMKHGLCALMKFCATELGIKNLYLRVFSDNARAIHYYENCGFSEIGKISLKKSEEINCIKWEPSPDIDIYHAERSYSVMQINIENFL
jgi:RimJ/RimL family protein N-acetyltransferase